MNRPLALGLAATLLALGLAAPAQAGNGNSRDPTFRLRHSETDFVRRYPGDQALEDGAVRMQGPEKGPYVERCTWSMNNPFNDVLGLTQRCVRYTLENTQ